MKPIDQCALDRRSSRDFVPFPFPMVLDHERLELAERIVATPVRLAQSHEPSSR